MINELNQELLGRINKIRVKGNFQTLRRKMSRKPVHRISIPKSSHDLWISEIGSHMLHSKKSAVVNEMMKKIVREG